VLVVWKLDRLSRSLRDVLVIMERLGEVKAGFRSLTEAIDTTTPAGRMMMQMVGAFAEFERAMLKERTKARPGCGPPGGAHWRPPAQALTSSAGRDSKDDHQGRQDCRRCCPVVQGSPRHDFAAPIQGPRRPYLQVRQIAGRTLRQIMGKVTDAYNSLPKGPDPPSSHVMGFNI